MSLKFNVPILKIEHLSTSFEKPTEKNDSIKLFNGIYEGLGPVTIVVLYNIERQIEVFYKISNQINIYSNLNATYLAKLFGIIVEREKFCLIFERLGESLYTKLEKKKISDKEKFSVLLDLMELMMHLHENKLSIYDLRPSNIFFSEQTGDVRLIYPLENIHLFRDEIEEEEEIIEKMLNPDDFLLRFTPPELIFDPPINFSGNDIWMLGCLLIEIFSKFKVWDGYTENEIIKQLKNLAAPKVPNDIPQSLWGLICECLNPFYKVRVDIKDTLTRFYYLCGKLGLTEYQIRIQNFHQLQGLLPVSGNISVTSQNVSVNEDPYAIRKCQIHPKNMIDLFCVQCNDLICTKCQFGAHKDHNEENVIVDIENYLQQADTQFQVFREKFKKFIEISSSNFPIDETIFEYINKQTNVIDVLYEDQRAFVVNQFDLFHKKVELLKDLEIQNLDRFRNFFKGKFTDLESKITELVEEKTDVDEFLISREKELSDFVNLDNFSKENIVRRIQSDMNNLKSKKQIIMTLFKEYQKNIGDSDKIKRYFQRSILNLKENKAYELIKVLEKLYNQLDTKYKSIDLQEYMNTIIVELDEYALINSRNNAPKNVKDILIACFKSRKVLSYNILNNQLNVIEAAFKDLSINMFLNFSRSININGLLYVNGGWDDSKKIALKYHLVFDNTTWKVTEEPEMLYGHSAHSLIYVPPNYIFVISGSGIGKNFI